MKKKTIILFIIFLALLGAGLGVNYLLSLHKVTFALDEDTKDITIFTEDNKTITKLTASGSTLLKEGNYYVVPSGDNIANDKIQFTINTKDITLDIKPSYTDEFLSASLKEESSKIEGAIATKYPSIISNYTLISGTLYGRGEWFGGLLKPKVADTRDQRDNYRVVLHKEDAVWKVIRRPEYILSSSRYEDVPVEILKKINALTE